MLSRTALYWLAGVALAGGIARAAPAIEGNGPFIHAHGAAVDTDNPYRNPIQRANLIAGNLGTVYPKALYLCCDAVRISGPDALGDRQSYAAVQFVPKADATATTLVVGLGYNLGLNSFTLSLFADAGGVPGTPLLTGVVRSRPNFGSCCEPAIVTGPGVALKAGTPYWVGITLDHAQRATLGGWNLNAPNQIGTALLALDTGSGWQPYGPTVPAPSFGVYK